MGIVVVQRTGLRMSGVLVVPLLAVYSLYTFAALPLFLASAAFAYFGVGVIQERTLIYGRQLLIVCLALGAALPLAITLVPGFGELLGPSSASVFFGTIIPGMAAYNFHALDAENRLIDLGVSTAALVGLLLVGAGLVSRTVAAALDPTLTSILFTPASDVARLRGAVRVNAMPTTSVTRELSLAVIFVGLALSEAVDARWGIRTGGLIAVPLLVVFSLSNAWVLPVYLVGAATVYASLRLFNAMTLVYGRVLLSLGLVTALVYAATVAAFTTTVVGFLLYFTAILAGVGAYNFHLVAPAERTNTAAVTAGLFALVLSGSRLLVEPPEIGALSSVTAVHALLIAGGLAAAGYAAYGLERRRRSIAPHHARGYL